MIYYRFDLEWNGSAPVIKFNHPADDEWYTPLKLFDETESTARLNAFEREYTNHVLFEMNEQFKNEFKLNRDFLICVVERTSHSIEVCIAVYAVDIGLAALEAKVKCSFPACRIKKHYEITTDDFRRSTAFSNHMYHDVLDILGLDYRCGFGDRDYPYDCSEVIYSSGRLTKAGCTERAKQIMASRSMKAELERIYSKNNVKRYYGHPVHYLISANDWNAAMDIKDLLVSSLYSNGRLLSGRQTTIRNFDYEYLFANVDCFEQHIKVSEGGIVVIELNCPADAMGCYANSFHEFTKLLGDILSKRKKDTLFIFVEILCKSAKSGDSINNITSKADVIQITEGTGDTEQAKRFLKQLVNKDGQHFDNNDDCFDYLPVKDSYSVSDIYSAYNAWHESALKNYVYKAYKTQKTYKVQPRDIVTKPYTELQILIGLNGIKSIVDQIIAMGKVTRARESVGLGNGCSSMHMLFTGNPGTAKTTVARLIAQILKDEGVLSTGIFVECGRQDLVGKYVGWTAKIVEEKFQAARGGVLFIDEAYSLIDDRNNYGTEAINVITQLMENYRDDLIVIFAGYPDSMRDFLDMNEGLRSRIAFHLDFPDYSPDELTDILKLMCEGRQYVISDDALKRCKDIFEQAVRVDNFGNGRYVRNVLEQAIMRQSGRIVDEARKTGAELTKDKLSLLEACDFELVPLGKTNSANRIGFGI